MGHRQRLQKLQVCTRTTHGVAYLAHREAFRDSLSPDPLKQPVHVVVAASFKTGSGVEAKFKELAAGSSTDHRSLIVVTCDMSPGVGITREQFEFIKETASRLVDVVDVERRPVLCLLVHFPPEVAHLDAVTTTVPSSDWHYVRPHR
jgi:hypothetical protein